MALSAIKLGEHFSLSEMVQSETALRRGIPNTPNEDQIENLGRLVSGLLEPIRELLGCPIHINSGFRSVHLNSVIGGAMGSAHTEGRAADIVPVGVDLKCAFDEIRNSTLPIDKVIFECNAWIHIQIARKGDKPRGLAYTASGGPGAWKYELVEG